jgi:two-component system phosphate regulon sensor histidine kinase PhoR
MMYVGLPLRDAAGTVRGVLRLSLFARDVEALLADIRGGLFRAILIVTVLALLAALAFAVHLTRPIRALVLASGKVAAGDFKTKVHISRRDEFHALADGFNAMTVRLNDQFEDLTRRKEEVENVFAAIREGLAVLDSDGRIVLSNKAFQDFFHAAAPEGRYYWEAVRSAGLQKLLDRSRTEQTSLSAEIKFGEKHILAAANYLPFQKRIALVLHDLTERRRLEDIKRDFIVNVSHELRTPLTAISGAVELLVDSAGVTAPGALDILRRHVFRMRSIVEDLLKLGELEAPGVRLDLGDLDLESLARRVADLFAARAQEKGLEFKVEAGPRLPTVRADAFQIEQLLINLVDNAVKYTEKGGVVIGLRTENGTVVLEVRDSGSGIPEEHRERIFERFYRVDKSRSRILGGTGLGLSIVKHIVQLHGGSIDVRSDEGKGTTFSVHLPVEPASRA